MVKYSKVVTVKTDIMIDGNKVASNDMEMILAAWKYNHNQSFGLYEKATIDNRKSSAIRSY